MDCSDKTVPGTVSALKSAAVGHGRVHKRRPGWAEDTKGMFLQTSLDTALDRSATLPTDSAQDRAFRPARDSNMRSLHTILVFCSVLWVGVARRVECDSMLELSADASSLSEGNGNIHSRSLSQWTWRMSTVPGQIPSTLWEAQCSSSFCWFPHSGQTDGQADGLGLSSVPIYQDMLVLKRKQGSRCFTASFRRLAVGCTCVQARSSNI